MYPDREQATVLPLLVEELLVEKQPVATGRVKVSVVTREHEKQLEMTIARVNVEVERVPKNQIVEVMPTVREEEDTIIVPVVEEVVVVERRLLLKEELRIRRVHSSERVLKNEKIRKQEPVITRTPVDLQAAGDDSTAMVQQPK